MFYTAISNSGWVGAFWKIEKTLTTRDDAEAYAKEINQREDPKQERFVVAIKAHHKDLMRLLNDANMVEFNDGTCAIWEWE